MATNCWAAEMGNCLEATYIPRMGYWGIDV